MSVTVNTSRNTITISQGGSQTSVLSQAHQIVIGSAAAPTGGLSAYAMAQLNGLDAGVTEAEFYASLVNTAETPQSDLSTWQAGDVISALSVLKAQDGQVLRASNLVLSDRNKVIGIAKTSAALGGQVDVVTDGRMTDASWSFTPDAPVFLGVDGALTQTPPSSPSAFSLQIAVAIAASEIMVGITRPVTL